MQQRSFGGNEVAVDTAKFESWPLLRPDELTSLPIEVLRASVADLDIMCRHSSGDDPVANYARIQRERTSAILSERAAQARVQALLAGTAFVGRERLVTGNSNTPSASSPPALETAPSHDDAAWSTHQPARSDRPDNFVERSRAPNRRTSPPTAARPAPSPCRGSGNSVKEGDAAQDVRSPPRLQPAAFAPRTDATATAASPPPATTPAVAETDHGRLVASSSLDHHQQHRCRNRVQGDGASCFGEALHGAPDHRKAGRGRAAAPGTRFFQDEGGGFRLGDSGEAAPPRNAQAGDALGAAAATAAAETERAKSTEPNGVPVPHKVSAAVANNIAPAFSGTAAAAQQHAQRGSGRAAPDSAVRDNWGTVFVVGGGRRRRRPPVKQRSAEAEDTPEARRAQVEKERQERRKASLRRLMARKEQRALQQEARRKRKAAASRRASAASASAAAAAASVASAAAPSQPPALATAPPAPALALDVGAEAAREATASGAPGARGGTGKREGEEGESLVGSPRRCRDVIMVGLEKGDNLSGLPTAQHEHRSSQGASVDPGSGNPTAASPRPLATENCFATTAVSGTVSVGKDGGHRSAVAVSMMHNVPGPGKGGDDRAGSGGYSGSSGGSESESVSGGDSSDDDDLFVEEIGDDAAGEVAPTDGGSVSGNGHAGKTAVQTEGGPAEGTIMQQPAVRWASGGADEIEPEPSCDIDRKNFLRPVDDPGSEVAQEVVEDATTLREGGSLAKQRQQSSTAALTPESGAKSEVTSSGVGGVGGAFGEGSVPELGGTVVDRAVDPVVAVGLADDNAVAKSDDDGSDSGLESQDEDTNAGINGNGAASGGVCAGDSSIELPGPLDVQPVAEIEGNLGQHVPVVGKTRKKRNTGGLLPVDLDSPSAPASNDGNLRPPGVPLPAAVSPSSPRSAAPLPLRRAAGDQSDDAGAGVRVVAATHGGGLEQQTRSASQPPSGVTAAIAKGGSDAWRSRSPRENLVTPLMTSSTSLSGTPRAQAEPEADGGNRGGTEADTDSGAVDDTSFPPARYSHNTPPAEEDHPEDKVSDVDSYTAGNGTIRKNDSNNNNSSSYAVGDTASLVPLRQRQPRKRQQQQQQQQQSPRDHQQRRSSSSSKLPPPDLKAGSGVSVENGGDRGGGFKGGRGNNPGGVSTPESSARALARYADFYPRFAAVLSAHHNGRALTRQVDCRCLPLTSRIMSRGRNGGASAGGKGSGGLTAAEEEACLRWQWKLYSIHVRVIKDYAAVFSYGDGWSVNVSTDDSNSLVYSGDASALHYRVNSKARPEVYNIVTDVLNNRCEHWEELPTGLGLKTTWNLLWTWSKPHIQYSNLLLWQKVNHFPNSRELTRKDLLNKHISRFMAPGGRLAKEFHIMPQTFVLPHEFTLFVAAFTASGLSQRDGLRGNLDSSGSSDEADDEDADGASHSFRNSSARGRGNSSKRGKGRNLWIMKPVGMSRGRGIRLIDDIKNISYADKVVLQRYVGNPLLLDGYKFDLRLYVLVTSFNKLEAFIYKEGFARLSTHRYEQGDIDNRFIHLTNSSIQRLNETGAAHDSHHPVHHAKTSEAGGTKTTLSYLWRRLAASGVDVGALWAGICSVVVKSLVCVEGSIPNQPNSFELFGYDVLIDDRLRPWLIEVNSSPSMARDSLVDRQVKEALIFETLHLVDPLPFDRQKLVDILGRRLSDNEHSKARTFKQQQQQQQHHHHHHPHHECALPPAMCGDAPEGGKTSAPGQPPTKIGDQQHHHHHHPRRSKEEGELDRDLDGILCGRRPRRVGEPPARMGNFVRLCPGTAAYRQARRLKRRVIRPQPGDDDEPAAKP